MKKDLSPCGEHVIHKPQLGGYEYYTSLPPALLGLPSETDEVSAKRISPGRL